MENVVFSLWILVLVLVGVCLQMQHLYLIFVDQCWCLLNVFFFFLEIVGWKCSQCLWYWLVFFDDSFTLKNMTVLGILLSCLSLVLKNNRRYGWYLKFCWCSHLLQIASVCWRIVFFSDHSVGWYLLVNILWLCTGGILFSFLLMDCCW